VLGGPSPVLAVGNVSSSPNEAGVVPDALLLDALDQVELFLGVFVYVYLLAIFAYVILSWIRLPYWLSGVQRFLYDVCEPYLRLWRRILPFSFGPIDLTPMIAILALIFGWQIVQAILDQLH
jgi:YggT family protein